MSSLKEDIEEFTGTPYDELVKHVEKLKDSNAVEYRRKLWEGMIPGEVTEKNIWNYYRSDEYAAFLFWQAVQGENEPAMPQLLANVVDMYFSQPRILDYGCGSGMVALGLKSMGFNNITLADIPHRYNRFLKFVSDKYGLGFKFIPIETWNEYPLDQKYDIVICSDVLEHVWEPGVTLLHLTEHLEQLGYLYLSSFFNDMNGNEPWHLKQNNIYQDDEKWLSLVEGTGLKREFQDENGVWKVFRKT